MKLKPILNVIAIIIGTWVALSIVSSTFKTMTTYRPSDKTFFNNCGKTYPIDYVLFTNLFCEINKDNK